MHEYNLVHGDIKPGNIVVEFDSIALESREVKDVKLVDLGSAEKLYERDKSDDETYSKTSNKRSGTTQYRACQKVCVLVKT